MSFSLPTFNLMCNIWYFPNVPPAVADLSVKCNLAYGRRVNLGVNSEDSLGGTLMTLLLPPATDVRAAPQSAAGSVVEVPAGTGRFYYTLGVDDVGKGFANEHRVTILTPTGDFGLWPTPYP